MEKEITFKKNDVFQFKYKPEVEAKMSYPYHCFDGILIVREYEPEKLKLEDTFWGSGGNRTLWPEEAIKDGNLVFVCNLDEVEQIQSHEIKYYKRTDVFVLPTHQGHRTQIFKKKGIPRSQEAMLQSLDEMIIEETRKLQSTQRHIERLCEMRDIVQSGEIEKVYF